MSPEKIYLIDGSSYIFRAFYAIPDLKTSQGIPTNAIYGFIQMITKVVQEHHPEYLAVILDAAGPTFRHHAYEHYKANRPEMPEPLRGQIPRIKEIVEAFNIPLMEKEGYEADDIIGTLARRWEADGHEVVIISGDKDLFQLVSPKVVVMDTMHSRLFDVDEVRRRYGVEPAQLVDVFGLMGDSVDNIPGVPGIGQKRATDLIRRFGSLEAILAHPEKVEQKKLREAIETHLEQARLSKRLATVDTQVPLEAAPEDLRMGQPDDARLREIFKELEFHRLLRQWTQASATRQREYRVLSSQEDIQEFSNELKQAGQFGLYAEMSASDPMRARLTGLAFCLKPGGAVFMPMVERGSRERPERSGECVPDALRRVLEDDRVGKIGHNLKSATVVLERHGVRLRGIHADLGLASYILNPSRRNHDLEGIALEYLDEKLTPIPAGPAHGGEGGWEALSDAARCACERAEAIIRASEVLLPKLRDEGLDGLFHELEIPLIPVLARMEISGIRLDVETMLGISCEMEARIRDLEEEIHDLAGEPFNIQSPQQLGTVLFERLKLPVLKRTKTGYSTDMEVLRQLARDHDLPARVLEYRSLTKLKSTYVDVLPMLLHPQTGRIHTFFNQAVTATGRLSSSEPNLQNIPVRSEMGQRIRGAFVPDDGWWFLSADYSQVELRILAHLSRDPILLEAFRRDEDIHARTAAEIFGVPPGEVTGSMRREAKVINFGIIYGMSAFGLARELDVEPKVARAYIEGYFQRYKGVRAYLDRVLEEARERGYVETLMGRRRYLPEISSSNNAARKFAERIAINTPIQGTAADIIKKAMIRIHGLLESEGLGARMLIQVHDELLFEVPEGERAAVESLVREAMEGVAHLDVRLRVDCGWGKNWADAH